MKKQKPKRQRKKEKVEGKVEISHNPWYFLAGVFILAIFVFLIKPDSFSPSLQSFYSILKQIVPIIFLVFVLMILVNLFVNSKQLLKYLGKESKSVFGWSVAIITGIISTGPIYMWYPLLNDLQKKGVKDGFIATFLYNRAIKPALLPLIIFYFGLAFTIVLTIVMIIISVFQGLIVERILKNKIGGKK